MITPAPCPACAARDVVRAAAQAKIAHLTPRQLDVARLIAQGKRNLQISLELDIGEKTVRNITAQIYAELNLNTRTELGRLVWEAE